MTLEAGQIVDGKYRIARMIGEGGMGAVYEGENTLIRRRVAIKVLNAGSALNADAIRRFEREAQAAGQIGSDHILEVLDLGTLPNGDRFMVMEYLDGETLGARIARVGRLTPFQVGPLARQFLKALSSAHAAGIIHRDLKPENIFILREKAGRADFVKLIDFGISKFSMLDNDANAMNQTRAGAVMGTPCYMSPEQARGVGETDVRSDVYAVGVILYESVTGRVPFDGETFNDLMFKIALSDAPPATQFAPDLDPAFAHIIHTAMARDPLHRYQSVDDLMRALEGWMGNAGLLGQSGEWQPNVIRNTGSGPMVSQSGAGSSPNAMMGSNPKEMVFHPTVTEGTFAQSQLGTVSPKRRSMVVISSIVLVVLTAIGVGVAAVVALRPTPTVTVVQAAAHPAPPAPLPSASPAIPPPVPVEVAAAPSAAASAADAPPSGGGAGAAAGAGGGAGSRPSAGSAVVTKPGTRPPSTTRPTTTPGAKPPNGAPDFGY